MAFIRYLPEVANDLRDAADWYEEKRSGLGEEFKNEFWLSIDQIADRPLSFAVTFAGLRACRLSRFPYVIHFRCDKDEILVVAVMFGGRDTSAWINRG